MATSPANTTRFTTLVADYVAARPDYPAAAFQAMTEGLAAPVAAADVGCGTGISTRGLAAWVDHLTGVEPNQAMLDAARAAGGRARMGPIEWRCAPAERTALPEGSVHLVLAAQAFHWFDAAAALAEFRRIAAPGGRAALLWNLRDDTCPATAAFSRICVPEANRGLDATTIAARGAGGTPLSTAPGWRGYRRMEFRNAQPLDLPGLLGRARSASYFPREPAPRTAAEAALREAFERHARDGVFTMHYRVELHLAERA